jgi:apolipoprotein N-acyltransferase
VNRKDYKGVVFRAHTLLSFLIWNGLTTWWISYATLAGAVMAIAVNSFLMSLVWWLGYSAKLQLHKNAGYLALAVFWVSFEFFHFHWDIEWPWLNLGNGFANSIKMIQWYEYTGILGGTLWVILVNILIYKILESIIKRFPVKVLRLQTVYLLLLVVLPVTLSLFLYYNYTEAEDPLETVIVQPNIDPYSESYDSRAEMEKLGKLLSLADERSDVGTDLIVGPETVFERSYEWRHDHLELNFYYRQIWGWMMNYPEAEMIFGASTSKVYPGKEVASPTARNAKGIYYDVFNSAVFIGRDGAEQLYHKSVLVVGVEKMPFKKYLGFLNDLVFNLGGTTGSLGVQEEPTNFILKDGRKVAPAVCYESVFGEYIGRSVSKGAGIIVIITNDGWWRNTPGYKQHMSFARLRAVETRRSIIRSANTGISCFINQRGDILSQTGWWEEATLKGNVNYNSEITFYVKHGDYIARISLFISVLIILLMIANRIKAYRK